VIVFVARGECIGRMVPRTRSIFDGGSAVRLRRVLSSLAVAVTAVATAVAFVPSSSADEPPAHYYVALGDSLSRGYMPGFGDTDQGYADDLFATLQARDPSLQLVKLGCSGETTGTMINGGRCTDRYPVGTSQLAVAEQFLRDHQGSVSYLTLDIGANDITGCAAGGSIDPVCVTQSVLTITQNLNTILSGLAGVGKLPRSVGMAYYDPFLQAWLGSATGKVTAIASVAALEALNTAEATLYTLYGFRVADVATTFHSADFVTQRYVAGYGLLPTNVAYICQYTYMCSLQNIHANVAGYQLIADTFAKMLP
jgi:lysophospholipase L1-like esterase